MHTSVANNLAQRVVFRTLFSDELNLLEKSIFIKGTKPNKYGGIENYFLQARVVQHNLDTAALNKNINFEQCKNSYSGCYFCRKFRVNIAIILVNIFIKVIVGYYQLIMYCVNMVNHVNVGQRIFI